MIQFSCVKPAKVELSTEKIIFKFCIHIADEGTTTDVQSPVTDQPITCSLQSVSLIGPAQGMGEKLVQAVLSVLPLP